MQNRREWKLLKLEEMLASVEDLPRYPSIETIGYMLQKCREEKNGFSTRRLYDYIQKFGLENHPSIGNYLVPMLADAGNVCDAHKVFHNLDFPNEYSWNSLITCFIKYGDPQKAFILYQKMCISSVKPTAYTFVALLKACTALKDLEGGQTIHAQIDRNVSLKADDFISSALINMYVKCGSIGKAEEVFENVLVRNVVSWNALISGYAQLGQANSVLNLYKRMRTEGIMPNSVTFIVLLTACSHAGLIKEGEKLFDDMCAHYFLSPTLEHYTCMIDLFGRAGDFDKMKALLDKMPSCDHIPLYLSILGACSKWRNVKFGLWAFKQVIGLDGNCAAAYMYMESIYTGSWNANGCL